MKQDIMFHTSNQQNISYDMDKVDDALVVGYFVHSQ